MSLRNELVEYVDLLERLDVSGAGIDGDAVPRELRDILARTSAEDASRGGLILELVDGVHALAMDKLGNDETSHWSVARRSAWADGVIFAKQSLRDAAKEDA